MSESLAEEIAGMLVRIEANYKRETSGPGSRFEGKRLELVQAEAILRRVRQRTPAYLEVLMAATDAELADALILLGAEKRARLLRALSGPSAMMRT